MASTVVAMRVSLVVAFTQASNGSRRSRQRAPSWRVDTHSPSTSRRRFANASGWPA
jgi:hypothetical protein